MWFSGMYPFDWPFKPKNFWSFLSQRMYANNLLPLNLIYLLYFPVFKKEFHLPLNPVNCLHSLLVHARNLPPAGDVTTQMNPVWMGEYLKTQTTQTHCARRP
jgi:hypothetical protein